jgi:hypothetical protein
VSEASVPYAHRTSDGRIRLYYCGRGGIISAVSSDGLYFVEESGVRIASPRPGTIACDPTLVDLPEGGMRMYYKLASGQGGPGQSIHKIHSATSYDGLKFDLEGVVIDSEQTDDRGWASVPEAIMLPDGRVRLYYVSDSLYSNHGIVSAISSDGLNFDKESTRLPGFVDPAVTALPDGRIMLLASVLPNPRLPGGIYLYTSEDGVEFSDRREIHMREGVIDPSVIRVADGVWRVYYWNHQDSPPQIKSLTLKAR